MVKIAPPLHLYEIDSNHPVLSVAVGYQFALGSFVCITPERGQDLVGLRPPLTPGYHLLDKHYGLKHDRLLAQLQFQEIPLAPSTL